MVTTPLKATMSYMIALIIGSILGLGGPWVFFFLAWGGSQSVTIGVLGLSTISFALAYQHASSELGSDSLAIVFYLLPITFCFGRFALRFFHGSEGVAGALAWLVPPFASACAVMIGYLIGRRSRRIKGASCEV